MGSPAPSRLSTSPTKVSSTDSRTGLSGICEADVVPASGRKHERAARQRCRTVEVGSVDREHAERRAPDVEAVRRAVGVDEAEAHLRPRRDLPALDAVRLVDERDAVERVDDDGKIERLLRGAAQRLDHERAVEPAAYLGRRRLVRVVPERPDLVGAEAVGVARPGGTAFWVTPATPSSAFGTSTPCQWIVTPLFTSRLRERHLDEVALVERGARARAPSR